MSRLYVKMFAVFWLVAGTISLIALSYDKNRTNRSVAIVTPAPMPNSVSQRLADDLLSSIIAHDLVSLSTAFAEGNAKFNQYVYLLDPSNEDLLRRTLPEKLLPLISKLDTNNRVAQQGNNIARLVTLTDGSEVKAITHVDNPFRVYLDVYASHLLAWILFGFITALIGCIWLGRWISNDLRILKNASHEIAQGELSSRVMANNHFECSELADLGRNFDLMTEGLEHALLAQQRITKEVSHELRAPIGRIAVAVELAKRHIKGRGERELSVIEDATESLQHTITNILAMPRDDQESFELTDTVDLVPLIKSTLRQNRTAAKQKGVRLLTLFRSQEVLLHTRSSVLVGVFDNVLRNAIKFTKPNSSVFLSLCLVNKGSAVQVVIGDEGPGVSAKEINKIFQPFYRANSTSRSSDDGCGLGLAIAHRTVALHQGDIHAENRPNGGLVVFITLPLAPDAPLNDAPADAITA